MRVCLDVNVWVAHYLASARAPNADTACGGLARAAFAGHCRAGPFHLIISHIMLDTLGAVLRRLPATAPFADMARDQVELAAGRLAFAAPPAIILGGSATYPLLDEEDAGVLCTAMAGQADVLVTANLGDFMRGPRGRTDTVILAERDGRTDVVRLDHPRLPHGLLIASPFAAAAWMLRGEPCPGGAPQAVKF